MEILAKLRQNSRQSLSRISRELNLPLTTTISRMQKLESVILKHTCLLDFKRLGFDIRLVFFVKSSRRKELLDFLNSYPTINNISYVKDYDYYFEVLFQTMKEYYLFMDTLETYGIEKLHSYEIVEQLKFEEFGLKQKDL